MKFLAALLASASAAAYTACDTTLEVYASTATTCASGGAAESVKALVGICNYSKGAAYWYKVTECTLTTMKLEWHTSYACSDTVAADQK